MKKTQEKRYSRELTEDQAQEFWDSLLKDGKAVSWYARKYKTSDSAINRAYDKMRKKYSKRK